MSATVKEVPTRNVFCFSLSSNCFDTLTTVSLALAVWCSCTSDSWFVSTISTPTAGYRSRSITSSHWLTWAWIKIHLLAEKQREKVGWVQGAWGWNVFQRHTDEVQFKVQGLWKGHFAIGNVCACSRRGQVNGRGLSCWDGPWILFLQVGGYLVASTPSSILYFE